MAVNAREMKRILRRFYMNKLENAGETDRRLDADYNYVRKSERT